jgi:hypothetical protein
MSCDEYNKLFQEYEAARAKIAPYPMSTNGVPQSFQDVLAAEQLQRVLHQKSVALEQHEKSHACVAAPAAAKK